MTRSVALLCCLLPLIASSVGAKTIHVSTTGDDRNDGSAEKPFATLEHARDVVRASKEKKTTARVVVHGGTYALGKTFDLAAADSGTADAPVVFSAAKGETVVLSGGVPVTGWREAELNGRKVWVAKSPVPEFRSLWVGDESRTRARHPNGFDHLSIAEQPEPDARWEDGQIQFNYKPGDVPTFTADDAEVLSAVTRWHARNRHVIGPDPDLLHPGQRLVPPHHPSPEESR